MNAQTVREYSALLDPQGLIGDPVFDLSRYLSNEYWDQSGAAPGGRKTYMQGVIDVLAEGLRLPRGLLAKLFYIDIVFLNYWNVVNNGPPMYDDIEFAEEMIN